MKTFQRLCLPTILIAVMVACCPSGVRRTNEGLNSTLWVQTAIEYRMLTTQAYARARECVGKALADPAWTAAVEQIGNPFYDLPPAIIVDVDETVLDTSAFQAKQIRKHRQFSPALWDKWVRTASAPGVPGARDFLQWAAGEKNITVFYVTNRDESVEPWTRRNLAKQGFPLTDTPDVVLCKGEYGDSSSDKSGRRRHVCSGYRVLLLAGDNLGDFIGGARDTIENRKRAAEAYADFWKEKWIVLPNPMYGSWEGALYDYDRRASDREILEIKFERLRDD